MTLFGDYESINQGLAADALVDFTGGVAERLELARFDLEHQPTHKRLFEKLADASENGALMITRIDCPEEDRGSDGENGLIRGQGYTMTSAMQIEVKKSLQGAVGTSLLQLLRLFNPWEAKEWTGPWSDGSAEWKSLALSEWEKMGVKFRHEGEFWMRFEDFAKYFTHIDICHFVNTSFFSTKKSWSEAVWHSQWTVSGRNGGGNYESATFLSNPQPEPANQADFYKKKFIFKFLYNPQYMFDVTGLCCSTCLTSRGYVAVHV
ncbi:calpain-5-like [Littorina saxatilis]|uniref:calpain-5-like n=1 Tax=Littorina saxatilis TaxID=31220 RepID=UPI0038B4B66A